MADEIKNSAKHWLTFDNLPGNWQNDEQMQEAVGAALLRYDRDQPREVLASFSGDGNTHYDLSAKAGPSWVEAESQLIEVVHPYVLGDTDQVLAFADWTVQEDPTNGKTLVFLNSAAPAATETVKVKFSTPHVETSVRSKHVSAVGRLAAANYCRMLAARRAQANDSSVQADVTSNSSESDQWLKIANRYEQQYEEELGLGSGGDSGGDGGDSSVGPAMQIFSVDPGSGHGYGKQHPYADG